MAEPTPEPIERLARDFHEVYQAEAKRQGDVRHHDDYDQLSERIKDFDRALARHVIARLDAAEARGRALEEALVWCSGSQDFAPEGKAREGWEKLCAPLLVALAPHTPEGPR
jgi:hypothetical protein